MGGGKFLEASHTPETEHCVFSSPERQVGILRTIVQPAARWNTAYLQRAVDHLRDQRQHPAPGDLAHLSPLGWEHINLTGDYHWETSPNPRSRSISAAPHPGT